MACRLQLDQRFGHLTELLAHGADLAALATCHRRPGLGSGSDTLARLHQYRRVITTKACHLIVHQRHGLHGIGLLHGLQRRPGLITRLCLRAKEHQVLQQTGRRQAVTLGHGRVLHEHARSHALDVDVRRDQSTREPVKERSRNLPETARTDIFGLGCRKPQAQSAHLRCSLAVIALDHAQHHTVQHGSGLRTISQGLRHRDIPARLTRTALGRPQVGRVDLVIAGQHLRVPVLGKQRHGRYILAGQHGFQIFHQRKMRAFQRGGSFLRAVFGALYEAVDRSFHAAQHLGRAADADHLQRTASLVQLLARNAQRRCIQCLQIGLARRVRISDKAAYGLGGSLQRLAHFIEHPGQGAQVLLGGCRRRCTCWRVVNL